MILKVFGVLQVILIQVFSAQLSNQDLLRQNALNYFVNTPLEGYSRSRRQIDKPPVGEPENGNLPVNGFTNGLPLRTGMPFGNLPRVGGLTNNFGLSNGLPNNLAFNNGLPNRFALNNGMALPNNSPFNLPFQNTNIVPQNRLLPNVNGININRFPFNIPNGLPSLNNMPNGLPSLNNMPNGLPSFNNVPNALPSLNNVPNALPGFNNVPNGLPSLNNVPNGLPSFNNVPNGLPNNNNLPFPNNFLNLNNLPVGKNILNLNNVPAASLPNINNRPIPNGLPSFNNLPFNAFPPVPPNNGLPLNFPSGNLLPPINNQLPYLNNFRITGIVMGDDKADINRFPRNDFPDGNMLPTADNLQNGNGLAQQVADELSNTNDYQTNNGFAGFTNTPPASTLPNNVLVDNKLSSINNFPKDSGLRNFAVEAQNINNMQLNNGLPDVSNFQNYNVMPINEQRSVQNVPFNNDFADANYFPDETGLLNAKSRHVNTIDNDMPLSNGGYLNDILYANNGVGVNMPKTYVQNTDGNGFSRNDFQFGNVQAPVNNWHYDFIGAKMPTNQNILPEGVQMFSNVPSDYQSVFMSNNLNLAQELIKNLQIEGNIPFLNGLPVAGISESVTVLNGPCSI